MSIADIPKPAGVAVTVAMLVASNLFMTFAWYWHLRAQKPGASSWPLAAPILFAGTRIMYSTRAMSQLTRIIA